jgi:WD40 repeat protein
VTPLSRTGLPSGTTVELSDAARATGDAEFSPDGNLLATAGSDGVAQIFDANSGRLEQSLAGHTGALTSARFSADGRSLLTVGSDSTVRVWNVGLRTLWSGSDLALDARFSPDGTRIAASSGDGLAHVWNAANGRLQLQFPMSDSREPDTDGRLTFASGGSVLITESSAFDRRRVDLGTRRWIGRDEQVSFDEVLSPDGRLLAIPPEDTPGNVVIRQLAGGRRVGTVPLAKDAAVRGFEDSNRLVLVATLTRLELWNLHARRRVAVLPIAATPSAVDFDAQSRLAAIGENSGNVVLWDLSHGAPRRTRTVHEATPYVTSVDLSGDGRLLAAGYEDGSVTVWDVGSGERLASFTTPARVVRVELAPDATSVLTASGASSSGISGTVSVYTCDSCRDSAGILRLADARATRRLTAAELARFGA